MLSNSYRDVFVSMQACAAGYVVTYLTTLKLQLVS
jgi:hypothetical protein